MMKKIFILLLLILGISVASCEQCVPEIDYDLEGTTYSIDLSSSTGTGSVTYKFYDQVGERILILDDYVFTDQFTYFIIGDQLKLSYLNWSESGQIINNKITILTNLSYKLFTLTKNEKRE